MSFPLPLDTNYQNKSPTAEKKNIYMYIYLLKNIINCSLTVVRTFFICNRCNDTCTNIITHRPKQL